MIRSVLGILGLVLFVTACAGGSGSSDTIKPTSAPAITFATTTPIPDKPVQAPAVAVPAPDQTIRLVLVPEDSQARYRVREQLAGVSLPSDAIGATNVLTGTITGKPDGSILSAESRVRVDLRTLKSNEDRRDNFLKRNTLETDRYPFADFVPTQAPGLPIAVPPPAQVQFQLLGDLTVHNTTRQVTWDVNGQVNGNDLTGQAKTSFNFSTFSLSQPRVPLVLSIEDNIKLELDFHFKRVMP